MARIRSIHPGLRTDEAFMALSFAARDCLTALWMQADDQGVFECKKLTLKARIFPVDDVDMEALLQELEEHQWIKRIEIEGRHYGLCRNFRKWQRPKKPTISYPLPDEWRAYVGLPALHSPSVENQFSMVTPASSQMEEVGEEMEDERGLEAGSAGAGGPPHDTASHPDEADDLDLPAEIDRTIEGQAVRAYNELALKLHWPKCAKLSSARRTRLRARLEDVGGIQGWHKALARAEASKFLRGERGRTNGHESWRPTIDFFLQEASFLKIMEGAYGDDAPCDGPPTGVDPVEWYAMQVRRG